MPLHVQRALAFGASLAALALVCAHPAHAAQRTFVSTSGVDNPACSIGAPCRAFAAAMLATSASGEIIVLDSGGYGPVTIAQSVSIIASPGVYAGISVTSGHGVTIATAVTDTVLLRGITINNQGSNGRGIYISGAGTVRIENVHVSGFAAASGLNATPSDALQLHIRHSVFRQNNYGIALNYQNPAATMAISGTLENVELSNNTIDGLGFGNNALLTLTRSLITKNGGLGIGSFPAASQSNHLAVDDCTIAENTQGIYAGDSPGNTTLVVSRSRMVTNGTGVAAGQNSFFRLAENVIEGNGYGVVIPINNGGIVVSAGNNVLNGNANAEPVLSLMPLR